MLLNVLQYTGHPLTAMTYPVQVEKPWCGRKDHWTRSEDTCSLVLPRSCLHLVSPETGICGQVVYL